MSAKPPLESPEGTAPRVVVAEAERRPLLFVIQGSLLGSVYAIRTPSLLLGRASHADVILADESVSREHARISVQGRHAELEDLTGRGRTFVNEVPVHGRTRLADGDRLRIAENNRLKFSWVDALEEHAMLTLFELTLRDPLTRIYNRRYFERRLREEFSFARRQQAALSLLLIDIDYFKRVNDHHGHPVGDKVLALVASSIQAVLRPEDVLARYGGEEFVIIARNTRAPQAELLAERIRRHVVGLSVASSQCRVHVTVSVGVAGIGGDVSYATCEELLDAVDTALYQAKRSGRNRVYSVTSGQVGAPQEPEA